MKGSYPLFDLFLQSNLLYDGRIYNMFNVNSTFLKSQQHCSISTNITISRPSGEQTLEF